jgi:hypothetical protein
VNAFDLLARVDAARTLTVPDEQFAPFTDPPEAMVEATRLEVERLRVKQLREITPINPDNPQDWSKP